MTEPDRRRRRTVTTVFLGLGAVVVLVAAAIAVVVLTDVFVDEERRTAPTLPIAVPTDSVTPVTEVTVDSVVQGDEIVVDDGTRLVTIRVAGIDAPDVDTDQCWSKESRSFAERTLEGQRVSTGSGAVGDGSAVSLRLSDGTDFATAAVEAGMARAVSNIDLTATEQRARTAGAGLWGDYCEGQVYPPVDGPAQPSPTTFTQPSGLTIPPPPGAPPTT